MLSRTSMMHYGTWSDKLDYNLLGRALMSLFHLTWPADDSLAAWGVRSRWGVREDAASETRAPVMSSRSCACTCGLVCESCSPPHSRGISSLRQPSAVFLTAEWARCCFAICMHQEKEMNQRACCRARSLVAFVTKQCSIISTLI